MNPPFHSLHICIRALFLRLPGLPLIDIYWTTNYRNATAAHMVQGKGWVWLRQGGGDAHQARCRRCGGRYSRRGVPAARSRRSTAVYRRLRARRCEDAVSLGGSLRGPRQPCSGTGRRQEWAEGVGQQCRQGRQRVRECSTGAGCPGGCWLGGSLEGRQAGANRGVAPTCTQSGKPATIAKINTPKALLMLPMLRL